MLIQHARDPFKDNASSETNVQNCQTNTNATINKRNFKNHIDHKRCTTASTKDMHACGTDCADVKTTLSGVLVDTNGETCGVLPWHNIEKLPKLMDPK